MKTKIIFLFLALATSVGTIFAANGTCGENLTWDLTDSVFTVSGTGDMTNYSNYYREVESPWYNASGRIKYVIINDGVTSIGSYAFVGCKNLISVTIPNSVDYIGVHAFSCCSSLASIKIPNRVTKITDYSFEGCSSLKSVTIPTSVTLIETYAFQYCTALTSVSIPNSVTSIEFGAFRHCTSLTSVTIPNSVTSIEEEVFSCCSSLASIEIPNKVTSIGKHAFAHCTALTSVSIPNSVTSIGESAFQYCSALTFIEISNSVTSIDSQAFGDCPDLTYIRCLATTPPLLATYNVFDVVNYEVTLLYVPKTSVSAYKVATLWKNFKFILSIPEVYTITFLNWNGTELLALTDVKEGTLPQYSGATPTRPDDEHYTYIFSGWSPEVVAATKDATYTAQYLAIPIGQASAATEVDNAKVTATPTEEGGVILEWPTVEDADTYTITVAKSGEVIFDFVFDEGGRLISTAYAVPARNGKGRNVPAAEQVEKAEKGWRYEVKGLEPNTQYTYTVKADSYGIELFSEIVNFTMPAPQGIDQIFNAKTKVQKTIRDGQVFIEQEGKIYNLQGVITK